MVWFQKIFLVFQTWCISLCIFHKDHDHRNHSFIWQRFYSILDCGRHFLFNSKYGPDNNSVPHSHTASIATCQNIRHSYRFHIAIILLNIDKFRSQNNRWPPYILVYQVQRIRRCFLSLLKMACNFVSDFGIILSTDKFS